MPAIEFTKDALNQKKSEKKRGKTCLSEMALILMNRHLVNSADINNE